MSAVAAINVLDRPHIPATSSLMSFDMLHASLRAWSSSLRRCLISSSWLAGWASAVPDVRALVVTECSLMSLLVHVVGLRFCIVQHVAVLRVLVAVRLEILRILCCFSLVYWHLQASLPLSR